MKLGRVIGKVWATNKVVQLKSCRLFVIQSINSKEQKVGDPLVAADPQNIAGIGDTVVYVTNTDAAQTFDTGFAPVNASIVELVDFID